MNTKNIQSAIDYYNARSKGPAICTGVYGAHRRQFAERYGEKTTLLRQKRL